jgi:hypothetical protein
MWRDSEPTSLEAVLEQGEQILWSGRPAVARTFAFGDVVLIPATLILLASSIGGTIAVLNDRTAGTIPTVIVSWMLAVSLLAVVGRGIGRTLIASRMVYAVTDRRALTTAPSLTGRYKTTDVRLSGRPSVVESAKIRGYGSVFVGLRPLTLEDFWLGDPGWPFARAYVSLRGGVALWSVSNPGEIATVLRHQMAALA